MHRLDCEPVEAALAVAGRLGVDARDAEVVETGTHVLIRIEPGPVAARVTSDGILAPFAGDLDAEVRLAATLHAAGAPVIPPLTGVPPRVHEHAGRSVTLWEWWDPPDADDSPQAAGLGLAACHRALTRVAVPLRPWAKLETARRRLPQLAPADRALLAPHLEPPHGALRPIHGDAHAGNVLPGPAWHDWEDAQLGWVEWDLACLVATGRVLGTGSSRGETILAAYDEPYDEARLDRCIAARTAQMALYGILIGDAVPGLPERVAARLEWLASRGGAGTSRPLVARCGGMRSMEPFADRVGTAHGDAWEAHGRIREGRGGGACELRGIRLSASGIAHPQWNNGDVTAADADIEGARAFFAARGVPWGVRVPAGMPWPHGRFLFRKRLMGLPAAEHRPAPVVPGLRLRAAAPADLSTVVRIDTEAFEEEPELERQWIEPHLSAPCCTVALAELDGVPVATGYSLRSDGRAGACLYVAGVAVAAAARQRAIAAGITSWLLERGFAAGAELAHLHPDGDAAARLHAELGFIETPGLDVYVDL